MLVAKRQSFALKLIAAPHGVAMQQEYAKKPNPARPEIVPRTPTDSERKAGGKDRDRTPGSNQAHSDRSDSPPPPDRPLTEKPPTPKTPVAQNQSQDHLRMLDEIRQGNFSSQAAAVMGSASPMAQSPMQPPPINTMMAPPPPPALSAGLQPLTMGAAMYAAAPGVYSYKKIIVGGRREALESEGVALLLSPPSGHGMQFTAGDVIFSLRQSCTNYGFAESLISTIITGPRVGPHGRSTSQRL